MARLTAAVAGALFVLVVGRAFVVDDAPAVPTYVYTPPPGIAWVGADFKPVPQRWANSCEARALSREALQRCREPADTSGGQP